MGDERRADPFRERPELTATRKPLSAFKFGASLSSKRGISARRLACASPLTLPSPRWHRQRDSLLRVKCVLRSRPCPRPDSVRAPGARICCKTRRRGGDEELLSVGPHLKRGRERLPFDGEYSFNRLRDPGLLGRAILRGEVAEL